MTVATVSLALSQDAVEVGRFAELVYEFLALLRARRLSGDREAVAMQLEQVSSVGEGEKLSQIIDWLRLPGARPRGAARYTSPPAQPMGVDDPRDRFLGMLAHDLRTPL